MSLQNLRLAKSAINDTIYAGYPRGDGEVWLHKKDVTEDFLRCAVERWAGFEETIGCSNGRKWVVTVREAPSVGRGNEKHLVDQVPENAADAAVFQQREREQP